MARYNIKSDLLSVGVYTYGATVCSIEYKGREVLLGYKNEEDCKKSSCYIGSFVGRVANRIENGRFSLNGKEYALDINNGPNHLHGGKNGASFKEFTVKEYSDTSITLECFSADGEGGYPANAVMGVTYTVKESCLFAEFYGSADGDTLYAPTSHLYFNLGVPVFDTELWINAEEYVPVNGQNIPISAYAKAEGDFDFTVKKKIGKNFDHAFKLKGEKAFVAEGDGLGFEIHTDFPAVQLYTGEFLCDGFSANAGFAVEPEFPPDSINVKEFPSPVLKKGENFKKYAKYSFFDK